MESQPSIALPRNDRWKRIGWLAGLLITSLGMMLGAGLLASWLELSPLVSASVGQMAVLLVSVLFARLDGDGFRGMGFTTPWKGYDLAAIPGVLVFHVGGSVVTAIILQMTGQMPQNPEAVMELFKDFATYDAGTFMLVGFVLALQAGVGEELLFRGYLITRLEKLRLPAWGCILVSALLFGLVHWPGYGFLPAMSKALWFGIPTGAYFWYRRNIGPLMLAHTALDYAMFLLAYVAARLLPNLPNM